MRKCIAIFMLYFLIISGFQGSILSYSYYVSPGPAKETTSVVIEKGTGIIRIAHLLAEHDIIRNPWIFAVVLRFSKDGLALKAGEYKFHAAVSPQKVREALIRGRTVIHKLKIIEGTPSAKVIQILNENPLLTGKLLLPVAEGTLFPSTYHFSLNDDRQHLIFRMQQKMDQVISEFWEKREPDFPLKTPYEVLILASIIEKETARDKEKPQIAAVFLNRLKKNMKLQADPTIIYGLLIEQYRLTRRWPHYNRHLTKSELKKESLYNTYLHKGLPPTPICNPGYAALKAVFYPLKTDDLYFVTDGKGGHHFSKDGKSHALKHAAWRLIRDRRLSPLTSQSSLK